MTGCWASQSISRSGWSLRSSSAIATSRCAWPSPIGEEMYSARFRRDLPRTHVRGGGAGAMKSRRSRFTFTGSRAWGRWPEPSSTVNDAPASSASRAPEAHGRIASSLPWITSMGQSILARSARTPGSSSSRSASWVAIKVSASVSRPQPTVSSRCLVECGSVKQCAKKNFRKSS